MPAPSVAAQHVSSNQAAAAARGGSAAQTQQAAVPFPQAAKRAREQALTFTLTPGTAPIILGPSYLVPNGYLRFVDLHVRTVTPGELGPGTAPDTFPFNILQNVQFIDTGGQKMDDLAGYALMQDDIAGGSPYRADPRIAHDYNASLIEPNFRLRIARELFPDGRGALPNLSGSQKYRMRAVIDAIANIYTVAPTKVPTIAVDIIDHLWLLPAPTDGGGRPQQRRPPLLGLAQYRTSFYPAVSISSAQVDYQIKATGNLVKYIVMIARNAAGARSDAVFPDPFTLRLDNSYPYDNVPLSEVIHESDAMLVDRSARDTGVVILPFNYGLSNVIGGNGVASWLPTSTATYIEFKGRQAVATPGTIDFLVCEISTAEIDPAERSAMGSGTGTWQPAIAANVPGGV
jgi:hypothetical protein